MAGQTKRDLADVTGLPGALHCKEECLVMLWVWLGEPLLAAWTHVVICRIRKSGQDCQNSGGAA